MGHLIGRGVGSMGEIKESSPEHTRANNGSTNPIKNTNWRQNVSGILKRRCFPSVFLVRCLSWPIHIPIILRWEVVIVYGRAANDFPPGHMSGGLLHYNQDDRQTDAETGNRATRHVSIETRPHAERCVERDLGQKVLHMLNTGRCHRGPISLAIWVVAFKMRF